jgi:hypothetical protein
VEALLIFGVALVMVLFVMIANYFAKKRDRGE